MDCDYCCVTRFHGFKHRLRPIGDVIRDIKATGSRFIGFADDNVIGHKGHARELFKAIQPLDVRWMGQTTMYMADDEDLLNTAVKSGMRLAWIGIESIRPSNLEEVHRKINQVDEFERRIKAFRDRGVLVATNLMFGFDDETEEHYEETFNFLTRNRVFPFLWMLTPAPGTALFERFDKEGRLLHKDWSRYNAYEMVFKPKNFSPEKVDDMFWELGRRLFSFKENFRRSFSLMRMNNLKEDFFIRSGEFMIGTAVGRAARERWPTTW
ncbi:MAG: radical SAM protein [Deltaproteobacteria bacterium]|nr:radical SAM protein [Deltaproteobacteria bacterium]